MTSLEDIHNAKLDDDLKDYIPFKFATPQEYINFLDEADHECLIDGWLEPEGLGWVIAKSNVGKTNFIVDMMIHVASGHDWYGNKVKQGHVYYFALEGGKKGIGKRFKSIEQHKPEMWKDALNLKQDPQKSLSAQGRLF